VTDSNRSAAALDALLHVFETTLADVPFPDVGASALREASDIVLDKADAVAAAAATLAAARAEQDEARKSFERLGKRALAYAQVYADGNEALMTRLTDIARDLASNGAGQSRTSEPSGEAPKKRGRPRKNDSLFEQTGTGTTEAPADTQAEGDEEAAA
jgi:hypothetical protein